MTQLRKYHAALALALAAAGGASQEAKPTTDPSVAIVNAIKAWDHAGAVRFTATTLSDFVDYGAMGRQHEAGTAHGEATWSPTEPPASRRVIDSSADQYSVGGSALDLPELEEPAHRRETRVIGDIVYTNGAPQIVVLPGTTTAVMGSPASDLVERWRSIDTKQLATPRHGSILSMRQVLGALGSIHFVTRDVVNGDSTRRFRAQGAAGLLLEMSGLSLDDYPPAEFDPGEAATVVNLWLDEEDNLVQLVTQLTWSVTWAQMSKDLRHSAAPGECGTDAPTSGAAARTTSLAPATPGANNVATGLRLTERYRFTDHGATIRIEPPPAEYVTDTTKWLTSGSAPSNTPSVVADMCPPASSPSSTPTSTKDKP